MQGFQRFSWFFKVYKVFQGFSIFFSGFSSVSKCFQDFSRFFQVFS